MGDPLPEGASDLSSAAPILCIWFPNLFPSVCIPGVYWILSSEYQAWQKAGIPVALSWPLAWKMLTFGGGRGLDCAQELPPPTWREEGASSAPHPWCGSRTPGAVGTPLEPESPVWTGLVMLLVKAWRYCRAAVAFASRTVLCSVCPFCFVFCISSKVSLKIEAFMITHPASMVSFRPPTQRDLQSL